MLRAKKSKVREVGGAGLSQKELEKVTSALFYWMRACGALHPSTISYVVCLVELFNL